jgi:F-box-like
MMWADLPTELLDKIFKLIPRFSRAHVGLVCRRWRDILHEQAFSYLKKQLIYQSQLKRLGCHIIEESHDYIHCSCIDIFFRMSPVSQKIPLKVQTIIEQIDYDSDDDNDNEDDNYDNNYTRVTVATTCGINSSKIFYSTRSQPDGITNISVVDRVTPGALPRILATRAAGSLSWEPRAVCIYSCNNLVVIREHREDISADKELMSFQISLWDSETETCLEVLNLEDKVPADVLSAVVSDIAINKEILAIQLLQFATEVHNPIRGQ